MDPSCPSDGEQRQTYSQLEDRLVKAITGSRWVEGDFDRLALEVFAFQCRNNPLYARYVDAKGLSAELDDWEQIPAVPQGIFKKYELRSFPADWNQKTFLTSGTTTDVRGRHHFCSLRLYETALLTAFDLSGLPPRLPQAALIPAAELAPQSSLSHMIQTLAARTSCQDHFMDGEGRLRTDSLALRMQGHMERSEPVLLLGTALAFLHWFEKMESTGERLQLPEGSAVFETGGYKGSRRELGKGNLYEKFSCFLGLTSGSIWNEYGMTEVSSQFYSRGLQACHRAPPWARVRVINPETGREVCEGETGILQIVDLANLGSVLAIETRDLAVRREDGFDLLGRDPGAVPRGCSRAADVLLSAAS